MKKILTGIMILMVLFGCSKQASLTKKIDKNLEKREYVAAIENAGKLIVIDENKDASIEKINLLIEEGRDYYKKTILIYQNDGNLKKYDVMLNNYESLNKINNVLRGLNTEYREKINHDIEDYDTEIVNVRNTAAEEYYQFANEKYKAANNKMEFRNVEKLYEKVNSFVYGYKNSLELQKASKEKAIINVVIFPIKDSYYHIQNTYLGDTIHSKVLDSLLFERDIIEYTNIITNTLQITDENYKKIENNDVSNLNALKDNDIDLVVYARLNSVFYEPGILSTKIKPIKKNIKVKERVFNRSKGKYENIYVEKKVDATKYEYSKKSTAKILLSVKIIDVKQNQIIDVDTLTHEVEDVVKWENEVVDYRDYNTYYSELHNKTKDEMLYECANKISEKYKNKIISFLK